MQNPLVFYTSQALNEAIPIRNDCQISLDNHGKVIQNGRKVDVTCDISSFWFKTRSGVSYQLVNE